METLTRNPFTDERLKELIIAEVVKRGSIEVLGMRTLYDIIEYLDPYTNPVTKHEFRAWLLDNGFEEKSDIDKNLYYHGNGWIMALGDYDIFGNSDYGREAYISLLREMIAFLAKLRNIHPFTLYAEIKLKYGTN